MSLGTHHVSKSAVNQTTKGSEPGYEWSTFTFRDQPFDESFLPELRRQIEFSEECLKDAYGRMEMDAQPWASHSSKEIDFISKFCDLEHSRVLDAGCGKGRHSIELAKRFNGSTVYGVDFSESNILDARSKSVGLTNLSFKNADLRKFSSKDGFDVVLSLYDVIGSLPDERDNSRMMKNISKLCKRGGHLVMSVMNMELTEHIAKEENIGDVSKDPSMLFRLKSSDVMHKSGDVFDPEHFLIDTSSGLVYRKERFEGDEGLSAEYVIRDRRYRMAEIVRMVESNGFVVKDSRYVRAGRWDEPLESTHPKAKEILIVAVKL